MEKKKNEVVPWRDDDDDLSSLSRSFFKMIVSFQMKIKRECKRKNSKKKTP